MMIGLLLIGLFYSQTVDAGPKRMKPGPTNLECFYIRNVTLERSHPLVFKEHVMDGVGKTVFVFQFLPKPAGYIAEFTIPVRPGSLPTLTRLSTRNDTDPKVLHFDGRIVHGTLDHGFSRDIKTCLPITLEKLNQIAVNFSE
jgi:hypothetical protein